MISILGYVLLGILFVSVILPLLDSLTGLLLTMLEVAKGYFSLKVAKMNQKLSEDMSPSISHAIGFQYEGDPEEDE